MFRRLMALTVAGVLAFSLVGCSKEEPASGEELSKEPKFLPFDYSYGLDDDGNFQGVNPAKYVDLKDGYKETLKELTAKEIVPSEEDFQSFLNAMTTNYGKIVPVEEDRPAQSDDHLDITIEVLLDGKPLQTSVTGSFTTVAEQTSLPAPLKDELLAMSVGEDKEVPLVMDETNLIGALDDEGNSVDLLGKEVIFHLTLDGISRREFSDEQIAEWARVEGQYGNPKAKNIETMEDLRKFFFSEEQNSRISEVIRKNIVSLAEVKKFPKSMIDDFAQSHVDGLSSQAALMQVTVEDYIKAIGFESEDDYYEYAKEVAPETLKETFVMLAVVQDLGINTIEPQEYLELVGQSREELEAFYGVGYASQMVKIAKAEKLLAGDLYVTPETVSMPTDTVSSNSEDSLK